MVCSIPDIAATDSLETSGESQPVTPRVKKPSRYPCRRAQRPAKVTETRDEVGSMKERVR
jgi:hypothetical protein